MPDQKRILIDQNLPPLKHRWNEAHEIGHDVIPWHAGMMFGDTEQTLTPACHEIMEAEANYAAGQLLFLANRFRQEAMASTPSLDLVRGLSKRFGNTVTSTLWRLAEHGHGDRPMVALVTGHPHPTRRKADFDPAAPCRYCIESPPFRERFGRFKETDLFAVIASYCGAQAGGSLGQADIVLSDHNGEPQIFSFETFFNTHEALTLGYWLRPHTKIVAAGNPGLSCQNSRAEPDCLIGDMPSAGDVDSPWLTERA